MHHDHRFPPAYLEEHFEDDPHIEWRAIEKQQQDEDALFGAAVLVMAILVALVVVTVGLLFGWAAFAVALMTVFGAGVVGWLVGPRRWR